MINIIVGISVCVCNGSRSALIVNLPLGGGNVALFAPRRDIAVVGITEREGVGIGLLERKS